MVLGLDGDAITEGDLIKIAEYRRGQPSRNLLIAEPETARRFGMSIKDLS